MINQVTSNPYNSNAYAAFSTRNVVSYPVISTPANRKSAQKEKEEKHNRLGLKIGIGALIVGLGVLGAMKGLPKGARSKLNEFFRGLDDKIANSENKKLNKAQNIYLSVLKKLKVHAPKIKMLYNSAPLKDVFVKKKFEKIPILNRFTKWTTKIFEKVSIKTSVRSYNRTIAKFKDLQDYLDVVDKKLLSMDPNKTFTIDGTTKTVQEWLNHTSLIKTAVKSHLESGFNSAAHSSRITNSQSKMNGLADKVWEETYGNWRNMHKNKNLTEKFVSEELVAEHKLKLNEELNSLRSIITNDISDNYAVTKKLLDDIGDKVVDDKEANAIIKKIRRSLADSKGFAGSEEKAQRIAANKIVAEHLDELNNLVSNSSKYDKSLVTQINTSIGSLKNNLNDNPKGEIQELLTIYKQILPRDEYLALRKEAYRATDSLKKSVDLEGELFDKLRDLEIGSAPTDALGVLSSIGAVGVMLPFADDKDGRVSVSLKYGIPAIGAVATTLYCTMGLVSGGASLLFGTLSGLVINKIGVALDNYIKNNKASA